MIPLDLIEVKCKGNIRRIELYQGDLTNLSPADRVDLLILSAFPNDYVPTRSSLIGRLFQKGVSVYDLSQNKAVDLRKTCSCWLSNQIAKTDPGIQFDRILCFEPSVRGSPPDVVGDIFRALTPFLGADPPIRTAAMPIVAAGDQGHAISAMLSPLIEAAVQWMGIGLPLEALKIYTYSDESAREAKQLFAQLKTKFAAPKTTATYEYDVFVSYSRHNADAAKNIANHLEQHGRRIFIDEQSIEKGAAWPQRIFGALACCERMVAIYSPAYVSSKVCQDEFNVAFSRRYEQDTEVIYPIYWETADLAPHMKLLNYVDCRAAKIAKLPQACTNLLGSLKSERETDSPIFQMLPSLPEADPSKVQTVPVDFREEVNRARAAKSKGWLRLLSGEVCNQRFQCEGLKLVATAQWDLKDWVGARESWRRFARRIRMILTRTSLWLTFLRVCIEMNRGRSLWKLQTKRSSGCWIVKK